MQKNTTEYGVAPALFERLTEIRIMLSQAVEAHHFAEAENDERKELAFRAMVTTLLITADRDMDTIMGDVYRASEEVR
jgi:hypothetical protein